MYGISIPQSCSECCDLIKRIDSRYLSCIELQGDLILDRKLNEAINTKKLYLINSYDYIKSSTILNALSQPEIFQDEVIATIDSLIASPDCNHLGCITIDFCIFRKSESDEILRFIKKLYYRIFKSEKNICLPVTIPDMTNRIDDIKSAFYKLMSNQFKICLNIYPHEIEKNMDFTSFLGDLSLRIDFVRMCYDANIGNYITDKLLSHWKTIFMKSDLNCPIIFVPTSNNPESLEQEILKICELIKNL